MLAEAVSRFSDEEIVKRVLEGDTAAVRIDCSAIQSAVI